MLGQVSRRIGVGAIAWSAVTSCIPAELHPSAEVGAGAGAGGDGAGGSLAPSDEPCVVVFDPSECTKTFRDDVFPILTASWLAPRSGGGCTTVACHGPSSAGYPFFGVPEEPTADDVYLALIRAERKDETPHPYVEEDNPNAWFLCNVRGDWAGGLPMPTATGLSDDPTTTLDDDDLSTITEWVRCGMKLDGLGSGGAGGG